MSDWLIGSAALALALGTLVFLIRKSGTKEERRRAKAIEDSRVRRTPVKANEQPLVDAWKQDVEEVRKENATGEIPKYRDDPKRPTVREVARKYRRSGKHATHAGRVRRPKAPDPLSGPLPRELEQTVMLPPAPPAWHLESFTTEIWKKPRERSAGAR